MGDIKNTVLNDGNEVVSPSEEKKIEELIKKFNQEYGTLVHLGVFYDKTGTSFHYNLNDAKYLYPKDITSVNNSYGLAGLGDNNWYVEASFNDNNREYFYLIPIGFIIVSFVLFIVWLVSKMNNRRYLKLTNSNS